MSHENCLTPLIRQLRNGFENNSMSFAAAARLTEKYPGEYLKHVKEGAITRPFLHGFAMSHTVRGAILVAEYLKSKGKVSFDLLQAMALMPTALVSDSGGKVTNDEDVASSLYGAASRNTLEGWSKAEKAQHERDTAAFQDEQKRIQAEKSWWGGN